MCQTIVAEFSRINDIYSIHKLELILNFSLPVFITILVQIACAFLAWPYYILHILRDQIIL